MSYTNLTEESSRAAANVQKSTAVAGKEQKDSGHAPKKQELKTAEKNLNIFTAIHHGLVTITAFFPSRGDYIVGADGTVTVGASERFCLTGKSLALYVSFHAAAYIFVGFFVMSLWGYRTINRFQFWLTENRRKNMFWCITPEPQMLKLANDILKNAPSLSQPVFSVEEAEVGDPKILFQEMNYRKFCLKLRKPGQIHKNCLRAAKHFFLSENSDWNVNMAQAVLNKRKAENIVSHTKLYIKINNDARIVYYIRWVDQYRKDPSVEIIFIDECALIIDNFMQDHHILQTFPECIDPQNAAVNKENGFKYLLIGFGGLGQELLKHLLCDTQFLDSEGNRVPVDIHIIEKNTERTTLFQKQYAELCERFPLSFIKSRSVCNDSCGKEENIAAGSAEFYSFMEEHYQQYDRILIALGDVSLNIETVAQIEDILRKNIDLSQGSPKEEVEKWKKRVFLISPEISDSVLKYEKNYNLFTVIGAEKEVYTCRYIIEEDIYTRGKLVNHRYCGDALSRDPDWKKIDAEWTKSGFYERKSSYAAALGLENIRLLLKEKYISDPDGFRSWLSSNEILKQRLGKMEHNRWFAYMLCAGYSVWQNPCQRLNILEKANQVGNFLRHATMVEWEDLPEMDSVFRNLIKISLEEKGEVTSKLALKARVCDTEITDFKALPVEGTITLSVTQNQECLKERLEEKLKQLSEISGAAIGIKPVEADRGILYLMNRNQFLIKQDIEKISESCFAEFTVLINSGNNNGTEVAVGYKIKNGIIEIRDASMGSNISVSKKHAHFQTVEQTLQFSGVLQCCSPLEFTKNFQQKDLVLIEDLPLFFGISEE